MSDLISRQAAIDAMNHISDSICEQQAIDALCELPSADRKGRWIKHGEPPWYVIECSECGAKWQMSGSWDANNFCGNCGAKMDGGHNDG